MIRFGRDRVAEGLVEAIKRLCDGPSFVHLFFKDANHLNITGCNFKSDPMAKGRAEAYNESHRQQLATIRELASVLSKRIGK